MTSVKIGKDHDYIWCDRYDYWSAVRACANNCWRFQVFIEDQDRVPSKRRSSGCSTFKDMDDEQYEMLMTTITS